ncbi:TlpA disulfide reductase family protein [Lachnoclostridium phytofermentans]|uniref:Alkyl hydroperoxide reductase/ Thiol specific antioxidant/ Mal allergen n=1 Tax=Lachnoclostridium phytofermentans (strain ATCC 700394 / DSM 18823 / ISDg) TaxID=357809 RepID=A9KRB8_LACP7|nr:TlpA disulfide reductase family protein [Lachnoclostridium phytofermentans]ABX40586.1 alkyl hydroperoxide reductase/ Thiol specific antioxidant/ Mal allergen [Lachnoclostridium phytofermentans ISDg]
MKKWLSMLILAICMFSLVACSNNEIEGTKQPFPEFEGVDFEGNSVSNDIFKDYDATIINFWTNGCGSCIAEMPELEEYYQKFKEKNINLIAVAASAGDSDEMRLGAEKILKEKGVTFTNIIPDINSSFYKDFICEITGFPITYIVDSEGNMIGAPLIGVVKKQEDTLMKRLDKITEQ